MLQQQQKQMIEEAQNNRLKHEEKIMTAKEKSDFELMKKRQVFLEINL